VFYQSESRTQVRAATAAFHRLANGVKVMTGLRPVAGFCERGHETLESLANLSQMTWLYRSVG
jgi:hypothetical protein